MTRPPVTVLAFDFGLRRIGIAVGNTLTGSARVLTTIDDARDEPRWVELTRIIKAWQPDLLVVGIPVHTDGTPHTMTVHAKRFLQRLSTTFALPVESADERHTTQAAQAELTALGGGRASRTTRDAVAARLILQGWLDERARADP